MTDSEASAPQDDSDEDIYKDFPEFNLEEELAKLEGSKESYKQEALDLSEKVKVLTEENKELKKLNEVLGKNISSLLKTAQTEVHRKDSLIQELRSQWGHVKKKILLPICRVDSFTFRRSNRFGKDKFTTTEDLEPFNNFKGECLECKKNRDKKRSKSNSCENRTSSESESKLCKGDTRKSDRWCTKEESRDCDNERRLGHFRDSFKLNFKHSLSDHGAFIEKRRGSQFNRYSRRESIVGRRSYRQDDRHHSKFDSVDKRGHTKRDSNEPRFSLRRRDLENRKNSRRDESPEKPRRIDTRRNRSRSKNRTIDRKESSSDRGRGGGSLERDSLTRTRQETRNKSKESESTRSSIRSDESNKRAECSERLKSVKVTDKSKPVTKDRNSVKNEGRRNPDVFETKSPLDALYNEMIVTRSTTRLSNPKSGSTKTDSELEEGECVDDKLDKSGSSDALDEWTAPSKNEKPMTLYSKRMMEKISAEQALEKDKESKQTGDTKSDNVNDEEEEEPQIEENNMKDSVETERESGELTDDENLIESSKEFQEIAKVASSVDNKINKKSGKDDRKKIPEPDSRVFFKEPFKTGTNNNAICNNIVSETKEVRDVIEFSPFKNNYKLIEISPLKPPTGEHILDVYNKRLPSNAQTQKEVESKIFNLIMSLSGAPSDSNKTTEKTATVPCKGNETQEISTNREEHRPAPVEKPETGKKISSKEKPDEKKHGFSSRRTNNRKSSKSKQTKAQDKPEKRQEKAKGKTSEREDEVEDSVTPGETTQFLDFFLRTTSPSKPIVPAEQEMEFSEAQENGDLDSTEKESEANETTVVNTSGEKESFNSSSSEIHVKETHPNTKSPNSSNSKSKKRNSNSKEDPKEREAGEAKREKSTESKKKKEKALEVKADEKGGSSDETRGRSKRKVDKQDGEKQCREEKSQKRKRTMSERDEETKKQMLEERKTCRKKSKRDSKSEPDERSEETVKEDITSFEFFKPITKMDAGVKNGGGEDANKSGGDYKMTTTMSLTGVVCLETPNKCVEKLMINEQAIYHFMDSKANTTYSPLPSSKYPEMTPRRMLKNDLTLTDSDDSTNRPNQDEVDEEEGEGEEGVAEEEVEMSENENSDYDSDSGASAFVDLL